MSTTIYYDFESCNKCVEQLCSLNNKWETNRPKLPEVEGQGRLDDIQQRISKPELLKNKVYAVQKS